MPSSPAPALEVTLLGTGTSTGVPVLGCSCEVCTSDDPRDRRTRCSCYIQTADGLGLLIDTSPDFRQQALRERIERIDAVGYTHHHFDHIAGLDDLRPFFFQNDAAMPCYMHPAMAEVMRRKYDYIFGADPYPGAANVTIHEPDAAFTVPSRYGDDATLDVERIPLKHGSMPVSGYRIGRFAYLTDTNNIPAASYDRLDGVDVLVLDALRPRTHPTHFSFDEAIAAARRIGATQTYFIHMTHNARHAATDDAFPDGINLGYDGLTFRVE